MAFRAMYSNVDNDPNAHVVPSLEIRLSVNGNVIGRAQGLRFTGNTAPRPVQEIGTDRIVEFAPGIKTFQGSLQSVVLDYGDLVKRLTSMAGGTIDTQSKSAMVSNMPEFDIEVLRRGSPEYVSPQQYAPASEPQQLSGAGGVLKVLVGCIIESFEESYSAQETLIMESVNLRFIDIVYGDASGSGAGAIAATEGSFTNGPANTQTNSGILGNGATITP